MTVSLNLTKETRGDIVEFLEKVEQSPKSVTSERPIVHMPTLIRWWDALRAPEVAGEMAAEVPCGVGRYRWQKWRSPTHGVGNVGDGKI